MKVKINEKVICIPPHISATWDQVAFLQSEENPVNKKFTLIIHLADGKEVEISDLDPSLIDIAFSAHLKHLEEQSTAFPKTEEGKNLTNFLQELTGLSPEQLVNIPIRIGLSTGIPGVENIEMALQHNQEQAAFPDMPPEILEKVSSMTKMIIGGDLASFPKPEPHCNCMHCQLARAIHHIPKQGVQRREEEESITEEDLSFRTWDIKENGKNMYSVSNPLDAREQYTVYLGTPVGCTCGHVNCEHIKAVLYT